MSTTKQLFLFSFFSKWKTQTKKKKKKHIQRPFWQVCSFMKPLVKSTPTSFPLFLQEIGTEKYQFLSNKDKLYLCLCALLFEFIVSWYSKMPFDVMYLKTWGNLQPHISVWTLELCSCFSVFSGTYTTHNSFPFEDQCVLCVVSCAKSVSWLVVGSYLSCIVGWVWGTLPASCIRSLTYISLSSWCDNFEPQEGRMVTLLRIVGSRNGKLASLSSSRAFS
jgi:hypothetical protein